ncbi:MAG: hypothetical protein WAN44_05880 [Propionibacteriaceae bacterium]
MANTADLPTRDLHRIRPNPSLVEYSSEALNACSSASVICESTPVNASRWALLLIGRVRPAAWKSRQTTTARTTNARIPWADGGAARLGRPHPDVAYVPANCVGRGGV